MEAGGYRLAPDTIAAEGEECPEEYRYEKAVTSGSYKSPFA